MLKLTRRVGETIVIGDDVRLTIIGVQGNHVRIAIDAPKEIPVHRQEVYNRIKNENNNYKNSHLTYFDHFDRNFIDRSEEILLNNKGG